METFWNIVQHPFSWGLALGVLLAFFSLWSHWKTRRELKRYKRHLSDKLEIEAQHHQEMKRERATLQQETARLRQKVQMLQEEPARRLERELEILARAEKKMTLSAPGFVSAWETAKREALAQLEAEESGKSLPKRIFQRFLKGPEEKPTPLPSREEPSSSHES